ncbi:exo-rhamnogalacturonan lyase family protein [Gracilibacillus sp. D59]|uniref:exo-rhamnogalacturonan lyase family protein n=1 Tax=Gracilibacillus sp. D59 TaxID=3457434 RepID=UPI003FCD59AB
MTNNIALSWLEKKPEINTGITWGIPWEKGMLNKKDSLTLVDTNELEIPLQSWPTAFWPDGSVKWTAHAVSLKDEVCVDRYQVKKGKPVEKMNPLTIHDQADFIHINTGDLTYKVNKTGDMVIGEVYYGESLVCEGGYLKGIRESKNRTDGIVTSKQEVFYSEIKNVVVEQKGPIRAVVKISGRHKINSDKREWLPFTLRLYFYAGQYTVKAVHTFLYDGNPHKDFIKGIGIDFKVPMNGPLYNRYIKFAGDSGFFSESPKGMLTWRTKGRYEELYKMQMDGKPFEFDAEDKHFVALLDDSATWDNFKLVQISADSYTISKQTKEECAWIRAVSGKRSGGLAYVGSESGGIAVAIRNFWQKHPSSLEIKQLSEQTSTLTAWFWSPDAPTMDLRHYDTETHVKSSYEGAEEFRSTPYGIGNTSELTIGFFHSTPDQEELQTFVQEKESPPLLVCDPTYYHDTKALGVWSLKDESTPIKAKLESALDEVLQFYLDEVEQRGWYGFWDYGDVMHSYDHVRHVWKYDLGGCAWQNTELAPNYWLWYMFLRSGREDIFRFAEAMTRHTSEVDVYHFGEYAGLGSRHNVLHWGCGCKEARIGAAGLHKIYYYLTADERIGDIMDEVVNADYTTEQIPPMRAYFPRDHFPTHVRSGPDWAAFCSNWLTKWERYEDTNFRDKMLTGINSLKNMPYRLLTGPVFGYEPRTGELMFFGNENSGHHLIMSMGGAQVWMEMAEVLEDSEWNDMLVEFGEFYNLSKEEKSQRTSGEIRGDKPWGTPMLSSTLVAFAAAQRKDAELAKQAWSYLLEDSTHWQIKTPLNIDKTEDYVRPLSEVKSISTNTASQWSLNVIVCLELIDQYLEISMPKDRESI